MGRVNHISFFINQVEQQYQIKFESQGFGSGGGYLRPVCIFIVHRFNDVRMRDIARYFKCGGANVCYSVNRLLGYEKQGDEYFIRKYHELLQFYIDCCRLFIRKYNYNCVYPKYRKPLNS